MALNHDDYKGDGFPPPTAAVSRMARPDWLVRHRRYAARAAGGDLDLVFLGDSLTQRWESAPAVWAAHFGRWRAAAMGIDNDGTQQLLWRIEHTPWANPPPRLAVVLIGINNIAGEGAAARDTAAGIAAVVRLLRTRSPGAKVLVLGLLPTNRGPIENAVASEANRFVAQLADGDMVSYLDVGRQLLSRHGDVRPELQPDGVHLSPAGYAILAQALAPAVAELLGECRLAPA